MTNDDTRRVLDAIEQDTSPDAARAFTDVAARYFASTRDESGAVSAPPPPPELAARFAGSLPRDGRPLAEVAGRLEREVVATANRLCHPMYMGHQVSAPLPAAVWAESVVSALNNSLAVYEMSPAGTAVESAVIRWACDLVGFGDGAGGSFTSGGTEATLAALLAARSHAIPDVWRDGVGAEPPVVVCGEHAHYAVSRAVGEMGLGMRSVVTVPSRDWRMDASALERRVAELLAAGTRIMAVVATAGSTATGSFDDLDTIGRLCERHELWLHVDGAHGASALLSATHRARMRGVERARSLAWDPHKMMLLPLAAGMVLVRQEHDLALAFAQQAPYLFHGGGDARSWDGGTRSFLCSRRADALKLWVAVQRYGADGIGLVYDHLCDTASTLHAQIVARPDFEALHEPESNILCFRFTGDGSLGDAALDALNRALRPAYNASGDGWITATVLDGRPVLRVTIMNPRTTAAHTARLLDGLARVAPALPDERASVAAVEPGPAAEVEAG